jgi:hypothetical protein
MPEYFLGSVFDYKGVVGHVRFPYKESAMFKPGQKVTQSGIYTVIHDPKHKQSHEITCVEGKKFPPCAHCGEGVRFRLKSAAEHVEANRSFR